MVKTGVDVGEMNKLLMKKVGEITLYLIEKGNTLKELERAGGVKKQTSSEQEKRIESPGNKADQLMKASQYK